MTISTRKKKKKKNRKANGITILLWKKNGKMFGIIYVFIYNMKNLH